MANEVNKVSRRSRFRAALFVIAALASASGLAASPNLRRTGCATATGKLLDEHIQGGNSVGRMIGTISGAYTYTLSSSTPIDPGGPGLPDSIELGLGTSTTETRKGSITFFESATTDVEETTGPNAAVLMTVTGGTGEWAGATGHLILSGFFHHDTLTGEWDYQGEICLP